MAQPSGYSVVSYGGMINCEPRMSAYTEALRQAVTPGCTVIDIGAGFGIFALLACQYGAGSVIAIEPDDAIELLDEAAEANNCRGRITIVRGISTNYVAPANADVIISDLRGVLPLFEQHLPTIIDARQRLLAPGGRLIPARDTLRAALVEHSQSYLPYSEPWARNKLGVDLSTGHRYAVNSWSKVSLAPDTLLSPAQDLLVLDYATITGSDIAAEALFMPDRAGTAHGFLLWFDAELAPGIGYSNAPGGPELVYGQAFFPFEQIVELAPADRVEISLRANLVNRCYVWTWTSKVWRSSSTRPEVTSKQSTFLSEILSPMKLARRSPGFSPLARKSQDVDSHSLALFDGRRTLGEIAEVIAAKFPETFSTSAEALSHVTDLSERYRQSEGGPDPQEPALFPTRDERQ